MRKFAFAAIFFTVFLDILGFGLIIPLLPFYAQEFNANEFVIGLLMASNAVSQFIFNPIWGRVSDKIGRRPIILLTVVGSTIAYLLFGIANSIFILFLSRILAGVTGATVGVAQSYISDITTKEERSKAMGQLGAAFALGFVFGPILGGFFVNYGFGVPGFIAAGLSLINLILVILFLPETNQNRDTKENPSKTQFDKKVFFKVLKNPDMTLLFIIQFIAMFCLSNLFSTCALFLNAKYGMNASQSATVFTYFGICTAVFQGFLVGKLVKRFKEERLLAFGAFCISLGMGIMPFMPNVYYLLISTTIIFLGNSTLNPCMTSLITQKADKNQTGVTLGVLQSLASLARIFGPIWGGYVFYILGYQFPFITGSLLSIIVFIIALKLDVSDNSDIDDGTKTPETPEPLPS